MDGRHSSTTVVMPKRFMSSSARVDLPEPGGPYTKTDFFFTAAPSQKLGWRPRPTAPTMDNGDTLVGRSSAYAVAQSHRHHAERIAPLSRPSTRKTGKKWDSGWDNVDSCPSRVHGVSRGYRHEMI